MSDLEKIACIIADMAARADCRGSPRVSISFDRREDMARFEQECQRDIDSGLLRLNWPLNIQEMTIRGVSVRLVR